MTVRIMVLARKQPALSDDAFRAYYRDRHLPFMHALLDTGAAIHRRHYVLAAADGEGPGIDVVSEAIYEDEDALARTVAELRDPEKRRLRMEDEARFLDPASLRIFRVETEETRFRPVPGLAAEGAA